MNECAFCGPTVEPMSPEDLFPSWLSRLLQGLGARNFRISTKPRSGAARLGGPAQRINVRLPVVCTPCNTQWMSQIENQVKPLLTQLILKPDEPKIFTDEQCTALIIWTTIKSIILDHADVAATGAAPFFTQAQRTKLRDDWLPPNRVEMWVGRAKYAKEDSLRVEFTYSGFSRIPSLRKIHHLHAFTVTIQLREVVIQALFLRNRTKPKKGSMNYVPESAYAIQPKNLPWSHFMIQLHPDVGEVRWPPGAQLNRTGFEALTCRISSRAPGL